MHPAHFLVLSVLAVSASRGVRPAVQAHGARGIAEAESGTESEAPQVGAPTAESPPTPRSTGNAGPLPYAVRTWTPREGLPQVTPRALAQTADGFLWVGTFAGLARFDGVEFRTFDLASHRELRSNRITALLAASDGALWIGTEDAGVTRFTEGRFEVVELVDGGGLDSVWSLAEGDDGSIWAAASDGLFRCEPRGGFARAAGLSESAQALCFDAQGALWIGGPNGLSRLADGELETLLDSPCHVLARARGGGLWAGGSQLARVRGGVVETLLPLPGGDVYALSEDREGVLWIGARDRTYLLRGGVVSELDPSRGPLEEALLEVRSILEDREGNLWFGGLRSGLTRLCTTPLSLAVPAERGEQSAPTSVAVDAGGELWVAASELLRLSSGELDPVGGVFPTALATRTAGGLWIAEHRGLTRLANGEAELVVPRERLRPGPSKALLETSDGSVWIGGRDGLDRWRAGVVESWGEADGAPPGVAQVMLEDSRGALWVGTTAGLARLDGTRFEVWRSGVDLPHGAVRALFEAPDGDLWVGTYGAGLQRFGRVAHAAGRNPFTSVGVELGLREAAVSWIEPDGLGSLLLLGNQGVTRVPLADLAAVADGELGRLAVEVYDQGPGIAAFEGNGGRQAAGARTSDGRVWFCTVEGLALFDPGRVRPPDGAPAVHIEWLRAGGERRSLASIGLVRDPRHAPGSRAGGQEVHVLPRGVRDLELGFTAPTFAAPERVRFQYRMSDVDRQWVDAGTQRVAAFHRLPPGVHRFEVRASNAHGAWGASAKALTVVVPAYLFERRWAQAVLVLLGIGLVVWVVRLRTARERRVAENLEREVSRRTEELSSARRDLEQKVLLRTRELSIALEEQRRDMERSLELEGRLHQSEKLEAIGRLAGGLAHDFNNILTVVLGEAEIARQLLGAGGPPRLLGSLDAIYEAGSRAADLTRQLLAYSSRHREVESETVEVVGALNGLSGMLRRLIREDVELELDLPPRPLHARLETGHLEQVVVNLVVNACDAMPRGGRLRIAVDVLRLDAEGQEIVGGEGRDFVRVSVQDEGEGMDEETVGRVFEPFFSTKAPQRGTGLGLASVHGIVAQSGGEVRVTSKRGQGTTFDVLLPLAEPPLEGPRVADTIRPERVQLAGTVLLCDDEDAVRNVVRATLEQAGLRVLEAAGPEAGLELARRHAHELDLLVTDVIMPGGNGRELAEAVRAIRPEIRVLYVSGYSAEVLVDEGVLSGDTDYISKPFRSDELLDHVSGLLLAEGLTAQPESAESGPDTDSEAP